MVNEFQGWPTGWAIPAMNEYLIHKFGMPLVWEGDNG